MNRITPDALYRLLPAVHRIRDVEHGEPLRALMAILAREGAVLEESIEELLDNAFIETCAPWAVPYIGGTIGYRALHPVAGLRAGTRAEVANTIGYRRRKGTPGVLEQLARDVTGWPTRVVEYFLVTATCQHMNHIRPAHHATADLRSTLALEALGGAFDRVTRAADMRSIAQSAGRKSLGGKHNFPNIGVHLWRLLPMAQRRAQTTSLGDGLRFLFDPLGAPRQLVNDPDPEDEIANLAAPRHLPGDISRRMLDADPALWYGPDRALVLHRGEADIPVEEIIACDLSDDGAGWNHTPHPDGAEPLVRIDPVLGRISFPEVQDAEIRATWFRAFPADLGGGEYERGDVLFTPSGVEPRAFPGADATLQAAIDAVAETGGIVEIGTSDVLGEGAALRIDTGENAEVILRAANNERPILRPDSFVVTGQSGSRVELNGIVLEGGPLLVEPVEVETDDGTVDQSLSELRLIHATLLPGRSYTETGAPAAPGATSLEMTTTGTEVAVEKSITGPLAMPGTATAEIRDSIVDAAADDPADSAALPAIFGSEADAPAGTLTLVGTTVIGRIFTERFDLVSNSILFARTGEDAEVPVHALRRQEGCLRFSYVPRGSLTPRRYRCQPQLAIDQAIEAREAELGVSLSTLQRDAIAARIAARIRPRFTALSSVHPAYAQLLRATPVEIRTGAADEGEMGVYHHLFHPQRETNLRIRIEEYLRFELEAGLFFET